MPDAINYSFIPVEYMLEPVQLYIEHGIQPGHFLTALFSNDFMEACKRADDSNAAALYKWAKFIYSQMPIGSYGSPDKFAAWISRRGLESYEE